MRVPRVVISTDGNIPWHRGTLVRISDTSFHHLAHVLRLTKGARVELISANQEQSSYYASIESIGETKLLARLENPAPVAVCPKVTLLCGMPKGPTCDLIVEKAVELGLSRLIFFTAMRTQGRLNFEARQKRLARFNRIRDAALKQSGAQSLSTTIDIFESLPEALCSCHGSDPTLEKIPTHQLRLALAAPQADSLSGQAPTIINFFIQTNPSPAPTANHLEPRKNNAEIYIIVGPEGGFAEEELEISNTFSYRPTSLGPKTLRTETAVVAVLSIINSVF